MKIGIDVRCCEIGNITDMVTTGIDQATIEIVRALKKLENEYRMFGKPHTFSICLIVNDLQEKWFGDNFPEIEHITINRFAIPKMNQVEFLKPRGIGRYKRMPYMRYLYKRVLENKGIDIIWLPMATPIHYVDGQADVFTIHDVIPAYDNEAEAHRWYKMILKLPYIISISEFTKSEITGLAGKRIEKNVIGIVPNSVTVDITDQKKVIGIDKKYILNINAYAERKNQKTIIKAFAMSEAAMSEDIDLVFVGGYDFGDSLRKLEEYSKALGIAHRVHFFFKISDAERNYLLTHAELFVNASTFEGFGRTPVEAAICKIPVITTKVTSLYEATMGLLNYVDDPYDADELCGKMDQLLLNRSDEEALENISKKLSQEYDAVNCARKYIALFQQVMESRV